MVRTSSWGTPGNSLATAEAVSSDGFYRSGDLITLDDDGYVTWRGRSKDVIRRGGLQIDPIEMEGMLDAHPKISVVVVVGEPHPRLGEHAVIVAVAASPDDPPTLDELCQYLLTQGVEKQSQPERLVLVDEIPRPSWASFPRRSSAPTCPNARDCNLTRTDLDYRDTARTPATRNHLRV